MNSFELEVDEKSYVGATYMARVANEIRRAASIEKAARKITQQDIADKIGTSRAVVNREMGGLENLSARRTAELLWAMGWEAHFEARKIPDGQNQCVRREQPQQQVRTEKSESATTSGVTVTIKVIDPAAAPARRAG